MRWPSWSSSPAKDDNEKKSATGSWNEALELTKWSRYTEPKTLLPTLLLTSTILLSARVYRAYLRRIPEATYILPSFFRKRSIFGRVTRVGDGDNFHLYHTPGGRLAGWGWFPGRSVPAKQTDLRGKTIHVRLAGIDAPEGAHFGKPAQPYSAEALAWLKDYVSNRRVRAYIYKRDQYERVVATVFVRRGLLRKDVGKQMLKAGLATIYEAKMGAEFGDFEQKYRRAEAKAKQKKIGMWAGKAADYESPRDYKIRTATMNENK